jgi:hypothetical protein
VVDTKLLGVQGSRPVWTGCEHSHLACLSLRRGEAFRRFACVRDRLHPVHSPFTGVAQAASGKTNEKGPEIVRPPGHPTKPLQCAFAAVAPVAAAWEPPPLGSTFGAPSDVPPSRLSEPPPGRQHARYVSAGRRLSGRILKGAKPADLPDPIHQASRSSTGRPQMRLLRKRAVNML